MGQPYFHYCSGLFESVTNGHQATTEAFSWLSWSTGAQEGWSAKLAGNKSSSKRFHKQTTKKVGPIFCPDFKFLLLLIATKTTKTGDNMAPKTTFSGSAVEIASPVTHGALDFFLRKPTFSLWKLLRSKSFFNVLAAEVRNCFLFVSAGSKTLIDLIRVLLSVNFDVYEKDGETLFTVKE